MPGTVFGGGTVAVLNVLFIGSKSVGPSDSQSRDKNQQVDP